MLKFLVTGAAGQLGNDVMRELDSRGYEVIGSGTKKREVSERYVQMDITDAGGVMAVLERLKPDIVIHCAAWTAVDAAEEPENYEKVWEVNGKGTANLASACQKIHAKMVYISTDYVFGGQGSRPWEPDCEEFSPLNRYGETKLQGEQAVKAELKEYFIVRIAWVFGKNGNNFVKTMLELGKRWKELRVVCDQIGTPTYTADLAKFLADLSVTKRYGIYHVTNEGKYVSWYDFAKEIFAQAVKLGEKEYADVKVIPVTTAEYGISKAARPFNSRLDRKRICEEGFQPLPVWKNALERYLQEVLAERKGDKRKMGQIKVEKNVGGIEGLCVIEPAVHGDLRGYFMETYNQKDMEEAGFTMNFVQDNQSSSGKAVLRGLHYQKKYPQGKLIRVIRGTVFDVAVDIRTGSATYGKWYGIVLSEENKKQFYIPEGFAHGFLVLSEQADFCYKCTDFYHPDDEGGIAWDDPTIHIAWPELDVPYRMSEKDKQWGRLGE